MTDVGIGTHRRYSERDMRGEKLAMVRWIAAIAEEYEQRGYTLTVRQIYYQGVARNFIGNNASEYNRVQSAVNDGRMAGLISWTAVEDRGRQLQGVHTYRSPQEALRLARVGYRADLWRDQPMRPEVWIEKQALEGVIEAICIRHRVDFYATKGYNSQSEAWRAGRRFAARMQKGQRTVVIHLGDHDPSGMDMTRDNHERLSLFAGFPVPVERVALNIDQVEQYKLPANPDNRPKPGDSRTNEYVRRFGNQGWELDALEPQIIEAIIEKAVLNVRDEVLWDAALAEETHDIMELDELIDRMDGG